MLRCCTDFLSALLRKHQTQAGWFLLNIEQHVFLLPSVVPSCRYMQMQHYTTQRRSRITLYRLLHVFIEKCCILVLSKLITLNITCKSFNKNLTSNAVWNVLATYSTYCKTSQMFWVFFFVFFKYFFVLFLKIPSGTETHVRKWWFHCGKNIKSQIDSSMKSKMESFYVTHIITEPVLVFPLMLKWECYFSLQIPLKLNVWKEFKISQHSGKFFCHFLP